jgi:myo-inositol 2-dehydrogenase/D-chiro-inositol 1-dehydrogenase
MRVGILGLGKMGRLHLMNALRMDNATVVAVADQSKRNLRKARNLNSHLKTYDDYKKLIDSENLNAVIISLPNFLKEESILYALEKNLDIFVDKPLARNFPEAERIAKKVRAKDVRLMVGVNYRYIDSVQKLKKKVDEGQIGDAVIATLELIMNGPFSHPLVPQPVQEWWLNREKSGGGALIDLGYHLIDICNWMFGDLELSYSTLGHGYNLPIEDSATLILRSTKTGTRCVMNVGWFSRIIFPRFNFRVNMHGTNGYISTDQFAPRNFYLNSAKEALSNIAKRVTGRKINLLSYTYYYNSFAKVLENFFDDVTKDEDSSVSLDGQIEVIKLIEDAYKKHEVAVND